MAWTTPKTWSANEVVTAALLNLHIRDNLNIIAAVGISGWTDYSGSATWTGTGSNPTYTVNYAKYCQVGKWVSYRAKYTCTTAGTGTYAWSLPVGAQAAGTVIYGYGTLYDASGTDTWHFNLDSGGGTTTIRGLWDQQVGAGVVTQTAPFTFAVSDVVTFQADYEAA